MKSQVNVFISIIFFLLAIPKSYSQNKFVELLQFNAVREDNTIRVYWVTQSESNSLNYTIERTVDFIDYDSIGFVQAAGMSDSLIDYSFLDENPPQASCIYYRLKVRFTDFTFNVSNECQVCNIIFVQKTNVFYPQPVTDVSYLVLEGIDRNEAATVILSDLSGRIVYEETIENTYHSTALFFSCDRKYFQGKGMYILRAFSSSKVVFQKEIIVL